MMFGLARSGVLATHGEHGFPHLVPIVFGVVDDDTIVTAVDHKPKTSSNLVRLKNIARNPLVSVLVNDYHEDWSTLWWARADGVATVTNQIEERLAASLVHRYEDYSSTPPVGPWITIRVERWSGWSADTARLHVREDPA
ncbi:MAG: TIGR03668 family PPOX class F420-dependent oxidoreductase [Actinobacteria bacterium]|nr:TIGR03668 family PPOX class F420-dependent oxidoreductase [Actinomycetota bacterium]